MGRLQSDRVMLMPIGHFARVSRLSIRALRAVDMPLAEISIVLAGDGADDTLTSHLAALTDQLVEHDRKLHELQRLISRKELVMSNTVTVKPVPAHHAAVYRTSTTHTSVFTDIPDGFGRVIAALGDSGVDPVGMPYTLFHQAPDADAAGDIALCVPVARTVPLGGGIRVIAVDAGVVASVTHRGSYEQMGTAYAAMAAWIQQRGHRIVGPTREIYLNSPAEVDEIELLTEIQFPIDAEASAAE